MNGEQDKGLKGRISKQGEDALGRIAEELVGNPVVGAALSRAFEAREKAVQAQEAAMGALGIPSAADVERLTRRLRSVSQRLEGIEDAVDRLDGRLESIERGVGGVDKQVERLASLDGKLSKIDAQLHKLTALEGQVKQLAGLGPQIEKLAKQAAKPPRPAKGGRAETERVDAVEGRLDEIGRDLAALRQAVAPGAEPPPRAQERLTVTEQ